MEENHYKELLKETTIILVVLFISVIISGTIVYVIYKKDKKEYIYKKEQLEKDLKILEMKHKKYFEKSKRKDDSLKNLTTFFNKINPNYKEL